MRTTSETNSATASDGKFVNPQAGEYVHRAQWKATVMASLNVLFVILAVRSIVMVAVVGAIVIAARVVAAPDPWRLGALAVYALVVVVPTVWLSSRR
ncbi:MAG TPA: hypothetical protein VHT52_04170 [Stellaceae bacterium]|nr:hypothetical protein [Stellaceae bacterium]